MRPRSSTPPASTSSGALRRLLGSLDAAAEVTRGTESYIYVGSRLVRGWTVQFLLLAMLLPFLAATVDLSRAAAVGTSRSACWLRQPPGRWAVGALFAFFSFAGLLPNGEARPIALDTPVAGDWPVLVLIGFPVWQQSAGSSHDRGSFPSATSPASEELGGHLAAMLVLDSSGSWSRRRIPTRSSSCCPRCTRGCGCRTPDNVGARLLVYAAGFAGPLLLLGSFAFRFELADAPCTCSHLASVGYVPVPLLLAFLAWGAAATQVGALAAGWYAPYPAREDRPERGPSGNRSGSSFCGAPRA